MAAEVHPRALADEAELRRRLDQLDAPHVRPLNAYVRELRQRLGGGESVPWFDPAGGGTRAKVLFLLEAPGPRAVGGQWHGRRAGSGFISADNDDVTAVNTLSLASEAGLSRGDYANWNIVPWYVGDHRSIRAVDGVEVVAGAVELGTVVALMPELRVVVAMGRAAQAGWGVHLQRVPSDVVGVPCVHPSPRALNRYPDARDRALRALRTASLIAAS